MILGEYELFKVGITFMMKDAGCIEFDCSASSAEAGLASALDVVKVSTAGTAQQSTSLKASLPPAGR